MKYLARGEGKFPYFTMKLDRISETELDTSGRIKENSVHVFGNTFAPNLHCPCGFIRDFVFRGFAKLH